MAHGEDEVIGFMLRALSAPMLGGPQAKAAV